MGTAAEKIRVLVAEDNPGLASAVCELLKAEPDIDVVGTVADADALLGAACSGDAHVVILDLNLAKGSSVPAMQSLRRVRPGVGIVVYSGYDRKDIAAALPALGTAEFVSKSGEVAELIEAVRRVSQTTAAGPES